MRLSCFSSSVFGVFKHGARWLEHPFSVCSASADAVRADLCDAGKEYDTGERHSSSKGN